MLAVVNERESFLADIDMNVTQRQFVLDRWIRLVSVAQQLTVGYFTVLLTPGLDRR